MIVALRWLLFAQLLSWAIWFLPEKARETLEALDPLLDAIDRDVSRLYAEGPLR